MHIASALTVVRREFVQSEVAQPPTRWAAKRGEPTRLRKILPGAVLLTMLMVLGGLFPVLF